MTNKRAGFGDVLTQPATPTRNELTRLFVRRLTEEQKRTGLSDNALAKRAKVGQTTISTIKSGGQDPTLKIVERIAAGLGVPTWYLLIDKNEVETRIYIPPVLAVPR